MPTRNRFRPGYLTSFSLSNDRNFNNSLSSNNYKLICTIIQRSRSKSYMNDYCHSWSDIPTILFRIFDISKHKFLLFQRQDLDSLNISWNINQSHLWFIQVHSIVIAEEELLWLDSKGTFPSLWCQCTSVGHCLGKVPRVTGKGYFSIHTVCYLLIFYMLLNI